MRFITTIILATSALTSAWPLQVYAQQQNATQQQIQRTTVPYGQQPLAPTTTPAAPSAPVTTIPQVAPIPKLAPLVDVREQAELAAQALQAAQNAPAQQPAANTRQPAPQAMPNAVLLVPAQQQMMMAPPQQQLVPVGQAAPQPAPQATADAGTNNTPDATTPVDAAAEQVQAPDASMDVESSAALRPTPLPEASKESVVKETNKGIDMDLEPSLVGGMGEDASNGDLSNPPALDSQDDAALSYEDQLRIRTKEIEQRAQSQAFEQSKRSTFPLETYQIRDLLRKLKETQEAIQKPVRTPPTPQNVIKTISVDPSVKSEVVHLAVGNVTALNIVDMTGAPWPIVDVAFGGQFDVKPPDPGGSILRITPMRDFARGNMVIRLLQMTTPITFTLEAGGTVVNYRFDARIPQYGPNARMPIVEEGVKTVAGDAVVNSILEGVPPEGAEKLNVDGIDLRTSAYRINGSLYVRTPLTLLSPAWRGSATSADGMNVYVLAEAPILLLSDQGKLTRARLSAAKESKE